ncbi:MAG TPA: 2,3,4,5-tetrahydropyridine-2,6-dicarboxylate N-succinyltransferase, partial [Alcaligenes faecalis]|nr:2,3,4,5-tetrahydropyridine-2,6-dicarboxylate N-succinyltransferase [Alcaligenes faecalis]
MSDLQSLIESAWEQRASLSPQEHSIELRTAIHTVIEKLDYGSLRVAEKIDGQWQVNDWVKKAILLSFRINENRVMASEPAPFYDKVPLKFEQHDQAAFAQAGFRAVPGA